MGFQSVARHGARFAEPSHRRRIAVRITVGDWERVGEQRLRLSADQHKAIAWAYRKRAVTEPKQAEHFLDRARQEDALERAAALQESRGEMPGLPQPPGWTPRRTPMP